MNAGDRFFVDTNVLLYALDPADPGKKALARKWLDTLWEQGSGSLSWQVLHEFYVNAVGKIGAATPVARHVIEIYVQWQPTDTDIGLMHRAWHWMDEAGVSYWDALIVAAAERAGCSKLLSEDFQPGYRFGPLTVVNPFETAPNHS